MSEYLNWKSGDEVVFVDENALRKELYRYNEIMPELDKIYTIKDIGISKHNKDAVCLYLNEISNETGNLYGLGFNTVGFFASAFRKVQKHKTDISIFKSMLNKSPEENNKELVESQVKDMIDA